MKKFSWKDWFEFIAVVVVIIGMSYILYFGFKMLYHIWF